MAVLGATGILEVSRKVPPILVIGKDRIKLTDPEAITISGDHYSTGDRVIIAAEKGLPFSSLTSGINFTGDQGGMYSGGKYLTTLNRLSTSALYTYYNFFGSITPADSVSFYQSPSSTKQVSAYVSVDELDRVRFWETEANAYGEETCVLIPPNLYPTCDTGELPVFGADYKNFIIAPYSADADYQAALVSAAATTEVLGNTAPQVRLDQLITLSDDIKKVIDPTARTWVTQCDLTEWALNIDASSLDATAIGQAFGESVQSIARGSGSLQFVVDNRVVSGEDDGLSVLRASVLTDDMANARAKFYLYKDRSESSPKINGSVYYECDIFFTGSTASVSVSDVITGSANFVAVSDIKLKMTV